MTTSKWLKSATVTLNRAGIGSARLDALVLLEDVLSLDRAHILAHPETKIIPSQQKKLSNQLKKRAKHSPLAYIRGKTEFYGREFIINKRVLEPRPESETMIHTLKNLLENNSLFIQVRPLASITIIDVGTGSGALAITAKLEFPNSEVFAIDIDENCLKVARKNAQKHDVGIKFYKGDLLSPLPSNIYPLTAILANLPYVPDSHTINEAAMHEPKHAIFGGPDGLDVYRQMFSQIPHSKPKFILTESLPFQHQELAKIALESGYKQIQEDDFIQVFKLEDGI